jgi:hypothetical protein
MPVVLYSEEGGFEVMLDNELLVWVRPEVEDGAARVIFEVPEGVRVSMGCRTPVPGSDLSQVPVMLQTTDRRGSCDSLPHRAEEVGMYAEIDSDEARGKTFKALIFGHDADVIVVFEDETFFYLKADDDCGDIDLTECVFDPRSFPGDRLVNHGICTRQEVDNRERIVREKYEQEEKERRRRYFEELKKEFQAD